MKSNMRLRLWSFLKQMKIKQKDLAIELGMHKVRLCNIICCTTHPPLPWEIDRICKHFDRTEEELFTTELR